NHKKGQNRQNPGKIKKKEGPMRGVTKREISEFDYYKGEKAIPGMKFHTAAKQLGVTAWGMNVLEIEAGCAAYPEHDHLKDSQEEVYVTLSGSGIFQEI